EKQIAVLIIVLLTAGLASLCTAYYLFVVASRMSTGSTSELVQPPNLQANLDIPPPRLNNPVRPGHQSYDATDRYLAYLPHSGFHNQRIALENALTLARILNRTLLLPPVRLGEPLSYAPFDDLYQMFADSGKEDLQHCVQQPLHGPRRAPECEEYYSYTEISWNWLVDLSGLGQAQRLLEGWDFTDAWLEDRLGISADDIYYLKDSARNEYSFQDFFTFDAPARKFQQSVQIATLVHRPERLIQLGTLFGSSRLHLRSSINYDLRKQVREHMVFTNPHLVRAADSIRDALGGAYFGVHLRIGDGIFEWNAPENVRLAWWKLLHSVLGLPHEEILDLERELFPDEEDLTPPTLKTDVPAMRTPHPPLPPFPPEASSAPGYKCRKTPHPSAKLAALNAPVFVSTDAPSPASNLLLARFTHTFPCTFFLGDFPTQVTSLRDLKSPVDGVPLGSFMMPFLDAMVVGQAWQVVGTEQSTFSAFVTDVLWRRYHGYEIVQRG
ncbi:hypothetical protein C8Q77DRAFT_1038319, partial [Trametes polyzona]